MRIAVLIALVALAGCKTAAPGIEVRTVAVPVETQKPCPGSVPSRPARLAPLAPTAEAALAQVLGKLAEWSAPGKFGDQAEAYFRACPPK